MRWSYIYLANKNYGRGALGSDHHAEMRRDQGHLGVHLDRARRRPLWGSFAPFGGGTDLSKDDRWLLAASVGYEKFRDERLDIAGGGAAVFRRDFDEVAGSAAIKHKPTGLCYGRLQHLRLGRLKRLRRLQWPRRADHEGVERAGGYSTQAGLLVAQ